VTKTIVLKETQAAYTVDPADVGNEPLILERDGKPVAAIISFDDYERFEAWKKRQEAEAWQRAPIDALADEKTAYERWQPAFFEPPCPTVNVSIRAMI
jgi:PHD/YefM family antitoxin component YafN of YafNO toxin-antitoxin module